MKKLTILLILLTLTLTACGASNSPAAGAPFQTNPSAQTLSGPTLLLIGSLKLDGTAQAITPAQAAELLPLWQVYSELANSDTAAQAEKDALVQQIEETMTAEQMQAIQAMNLTPQDTFALMQEMGLGRGGGSFPGGDNAPQGGDVPPFDGGGGFPGGGPPDGGGGFVGPGGDGGFPGQGGGGQNLSQEQIATAQASRSQGMGAGFLSPALLNALIEYLQTLAGS
jgi:hypothetical protein